MSGYCCNNIFFYTEVEVSGLLAGDLAFTFHRGLWNLGGSADAVDYHRLDRASFYHAAQVYGCEGVVLEGGIGDLAGRWQYKYRKRQNRLASGAMWINCVGDPERALKEALRPRPAQVSRSALGTLLRIVVHACQRILPNKKRASHGGAGADGKLPKAANATLLEEWEEVDGAPETTPASTGEASSHAETGGVAMMPGRGCVLPDRVTVNGTLHVARRAGELRYYDDRDRMLNLTLVAEEIAAAASAHASLAP
ncbi:MAG: hypothetical protein M1832_004206 [Thelocarpon impressellum]|nr:MAG: hypothetical protein M1832_004206 [Thelocarpon impressellum]